MHGWHHLFLPKHQGHIIRRGRMGWYRRCSRFVSLFGATDAVLRVASLGSVLTLPSHGLYVILLPRFLIGFVGTNSYAVSFPESWNRADEQLRCSTADSWMKDKPVSSVSGEAGKNIFFYSISRKYCLFAVLVCMRCATCEQCLR